jgi:predicted transposase YdaD
METFQVKVNEIGGDPMHEYDTAFKVTLQHVEVTFRLLLGTAVAHWHNVEFPEVRSARADLLGETETGEMVHIELQSSNHPQMPLRMLEYCLGILRIFERYPVQVLLYVGDAPVNMETALRGPALDYSYRLVDVRDLDGERLLKSRQVNDNIVALLTRVADRRVAARLVLQRIAGLEPGERRSALDRLLILAGLRKALGKLIEEEAEKMPILNDILDHEVLGREYRKGLAEGVQQGMQEGMQQGMQEGMQQGVQQGELKLLRRLIERRFGRVPGWAEERLSRMSAQQLEDLGIRVLDAPSIEDVLK